MKRGESKIIKNEFTDCTIKTRYRGSKTKVLPNIWDAVKDLRFTTVLDCFGGTGSVSYLFKKKNKQVTYNDHLFFNLVVGKALIENSVEKITDKDLDFILKNRPYNEYPHLIEENFKDIYYIEEENRWLDLTISNIFQMPDNHKRDMVLWALFQSAIIKRPFSLFHRKNLNLRLRDVKRSFGNKTTWDRPFDIHFKKFVNEINGYVFDSGISCNAICKDVMEIDINSSKGSKGSKFDLVYIDPPYIPNKGENIIYRNLYHFLEGIMNYDKWVEDIDFKTKHNRLKRQYNVWNDKKNVMSAFEQLIEKYQDSIILISHRSEGFPSNDDLIKILKKYKNDVKIVGNVDHKYALSIKKSKEVLILAK